MAQHLFWDIRAAQSMSKHDTIINNVLTLTNSRSIVKALDGWFVKKLVALSKQQQSCELCGTRFRQGAVVTHHRSKATVLGPRPTSGYGDRRDIGAPFIVSIIGMASPIVNGEPSCSWKSSRSAEPSSNSRIK